MVDEKHVSTQNSCRNTAYHVPQNIIIAGYFQRHNLGDDLFEYVWKYIFTKERFKQHHVKFIGLDDLRVCEDLTQCNILIFAGGDVLNYYFLSDLKKILQKFRFKGKLYAFSVGVPYQAIIVDGLIDQFNFIMCRAKGDAFNLRRRFGDAHVRYFPDISIYLPELYKIEKSKKEFNGVNEHKVYNKRLNVGIFLTRNIFEKNIHYDNVVSKIARALDDIAKISFPGMNGFELFLIPFNTNGKNAFEDDRLINNDVYAHVENKDFIHIVDKCFTVEEMWWTFKNQLDLSITMRYHSHMYAIVSKVPFVSMYTTRKVQNLLYDTGLSGYSYQFPMNEDDLPTDFGSDQFVEKFTAAFNDREKIVSIMKNYVDRYASFEHFEDTLTTLIENPLEQVQIRPRIYPSSTIIDVIESLVRYIWEEQNKVYSDKDVALVADEVYKGKISFVTLLSEAAGEDIRKSNEKRNKLSDFLAALACFRLIHIPYPKYHFGMSQKILNVDFNARNEFMWVWADYQRGNERFFLDNPMIRKPYFNATFVGIEDFKGCHRSGWQYVLDNLIGFHSDSSDLIFDNYIDRTFHWAHDVYKYTKIIPFRKSWCGFVHHTFDEDYSPYNVPNLFKNETFRQSLSQCFALFTLSHDLAVKITVLLQQHGYKNIHVKSFMHPTETPKLLFSIDRFCANKSRKIVQIGAWLRDTYAIHKLNAYKNRHFPFETERIPLKKAVLRGKNMNNYFKPDDFVLTFNHADHVNQTTEGTMNHYNYSFPRIKTIQTISKNKFVSGIAKSIHEEWMSVDHIDTLNNEEYDQLLSENIVFLNLLDASAVNTVIECIVRCTPLLVNRLAAVEEMLGSDYPFYYETLPEASLKMNDVNLICKTNKYLSQMNKQRFTMDYFMDDVNNWFKDHPLNEIETQ